MDIRFDWVPQINPSLRESAETQIKNDIKESNYFKPCHAGTMSVSILSTDTLEVSIKGNVKCQCGKVLATFSGASDGSRLIFEILS